RIHPARGEHRRLHEHDVRHREERRDAGNDLGTDGRAVRSELKLPLEAGQDGCHEAQRYTTVAPPCVVRARRWRRGTAGVRVDARSGHSARSVASGLFLSTSRLDRTPTAATSSAVNPTPATCSSGNTRHGISSAYRLTPQVSATAPADPITPASAPRTPYSISSIRAMVRVLAPSVLNTAASYTRWYFVIATAPISMRTPLNSTSPPTTVIASVTFPITSRTVSRISWKSITEIFGNRLTSAAWKRARPAGSPGPLKGAT